MVFQRGFTLIEVLVTAFVVAIVAVAVTGLALIITRAAIEAERQNVAQAIASETMESARAYSYAEIAYTDEIPAGKIVRAKNVDRNNQSYQVDSVVTYIDDPLTQETKDFKQLTIKVSWPRSQNGVVISSFFTKGGSRQVGDACIPGTNTCPNPAGVPAPFLMCPASGRCSDLEKNPSPTPISSPTPTMAGGEPCQLDRQCSSGQICLDRKCQPAWCKIIHDAPLIDVGACQGQFVIEDCTQTCPSYRRLGELDKLPLCGRDAYCVITSYSFERCPDPPICAKMKKP